jgi:hypothetical protein
VDEDLEGFNDPVKEHSEQFQDFEDDELIIAEKGGRQMEPSSIPSDRAQITLFDYYGAEGDEAAGSPHDNESWQGD